MSNVQIIYSKDIVFLKFIEIKTKITYNDNIGKIKKNESRGMTHV